MRAAVPKHDQFESTLVELCWQVDIALLWISPTFESECRRNAVFGFVRDVLLEHPNLRESRIMLTGSFAAKTYLPDSDIDVSIMFPVDDTVDRDEWVYMVNNALCRAAVKTCAHQSPRVSSVSVSPPASMYQKHPIRNVTFVNGRVKVLNCIVGNISVDITPCAPCGSVAAAVLMEEADKHFVIKDPPRYLRSVWGTSAQRHVFKRSVLLIKAWCLYESGPLSAAIGGLENIPILCSKTGRLSSYAISVMVLAMFNESTTERKAYQESCSLNKNISFSSLDGIKTEVKDGDHISADLSHPFLVLLRFLRVYSCFDWDSFALSIDGRIPLPSKNTSIRSGGANELDIVSGEKEVRPLSGVLKRLRSTSDHDLCSAGRLSEDFAVKTWHIIDPLDCSNNLALGVSKSSATSIRIAMDIGRRRIDDIMCHLILTNNNRNRSTWTPPSRSPLEFIKSFFPVVNATFGCFSQNEGQHQTHEVVAVPYRQYAKSSVSVVPVVYNEMQKRLWGLVHDGWPSLPVSLVAEVTHKLILNDEAMLQRVMDNPNRLVSLVAHALDELPGVVFIVPGNGFRADLLDHPMQRTLAFTRRKRRQRDKAGNVEVVNDESDSKTLGYDVFATELEGDLYSMTKDMDFTTKPLVQCTGETQSLKVPGLDDFKLDGSMFNAPSATVAQVVNKCEAVVEERPINRNDEPSTIDHTKVSKRTKSKQSKVSHKSAKISSPKVDIKSLKENTKPAPISFFVTMLATTMLCTSVLFAYACQFNVAEMSVSPVYDILARVIHINMTPWADNRPFDAVEPSALPTSVPTPIIASGHTCDDSCAAYLSNSIAQSSIHEPPVCNSACDAPLTRTWVLQGRDVILGDLVHKQSDLVYKWEKNNQSVGVITP
jgi:hypothetical protein